MFKLLGQTEQLLLASVFLKIHIKNILIFKEFVIIIALQGSCGQEKSGFGGPEVRKTGVRVRKSQDFSIFLKHGSRFWSKMD